MTLLLEERDSTAPDYPLVSRTGVAWWSRTEDDHSTWSHDRAWWGGTDYSTWLSSIQTQCSDDVVVIGRRVPPSDPFDIVHATTVFQCKTQPSAWYLLLPFDSGTFRWETYELLHRQTGDRTVFPTDNIVQLASAPVQQHTDPLADYSQYSRECWDHYGAEAITSETIAAARRLLVMLPDSLGSPHISPGADGTIGFEWLPSNRAVVKLFIDVGPGSVWSAYWRMRAGEKSTIGPKRFDKATRAELRSIFKQLSA